MEASEFLEKKPTAEEFLDTPISGAEWAKGRMIKPEGSLMGDIGRTAWGTLKGAGAVAGGMLAFPISGLYGYGELMERGPEASVESMRKIQEFPMRLLIKTPEEQKGMETVGKGFSWLFEKPGAGLGGLTELAITGDIQKATDVIKGKSEGSSIAVPIAKVGGEASAIFGLGGRAGKGRLKSLKEGLSAKTTEARLRTSEAKYGRLGVVPEEVKPIVPEKPVTPIRPLSPKSKLAKKEFAERFLEERPEVAKGVPEAPTIKSAEESASIFQKDFQQIQSPIGRKLLREKLLKEQTEKGVEPIRGEKIGRLRKEEALNEQVKKDFEKFGTVELYSGLPVPQMAKFWTENVGTLIWDKGIQKGIPKLLEKVPGGKSINRAFIREYRGDLPNTETYIRSLDDMKRFQAIGREYAIDLGRRLQSLPEPEQIKMGEYITTKEPKFKLEGQALEYAKEAKQVMLDLGRQAVDAGLLSEETFFKNAGQYMPRLYTSKEYQSLLTKFNLTKPNRLDLSRFKARKDIPKEIREQMGEILTPGYPIAKGIAQLTHDIEMARFFNGIARVKEWARPATKFEVLPADIEGKTWGTWQGDTNLGVFKTRKEALVTKKEAITKWEAENPIPEGFKKIEGKKLGKLDGAYVHPEIFKDLQETIHVMTTGERVWRKALGSWKFGKVILSPKTHSRNLFSNSILAHFGGFPMYEQPIYLTKAAKAMRSKSNYWRMAREEDLLRATFTNAELRTLFSQVESQMGGIKAASIPEKLGNIGMAWEKTKVGLNKAAKLYEAEEQWFKMAKFIHNIERKKMTPRAAAADAEKWLFNYSKLTRFQEKYRSSPWGAPFATFTFKAIPRVAEATIKTPWRLALPIAMIKGLEMAAQKVIGDTKEQIKAKKELRYEWMKGSSITPNFARVPFVDEYGREYYLNLTYILPWGDLGEGGNFGPIPGSLMPFSQPFVKEPWQQIANWDTFWKENIVREKDIAGKKGIGRLKTEAKLRGKHIFRSMAPTPLIDIEKGYSALRRKPDIKGRLRPKGVVAADVFAGVKLYPVDYIERTAQEIAKLDPEKGYLARKIKGEIKTLNIKMNAVKKAGGDQTPYQKQIEEKINQLKGLAEEVREVGRASKKIINK